MAILARIAGVTLPKEKRIEIGLTSIYGIGRSLSNQILKETNIDAAIRVQDLTEDQFFYHHQFYTGPLDQDPY